MVSLLTLFLYHMDEKNIDWIDIEDKRLQFDVKKFWFFIQVPKVQIN